MLEFLYFPLLNKDSINKLEKIENSDIVKETGSNNRGTIFVSMHYSNWELLAFSFPVFFNHKANIITKIQASKGLNEKINLYRELSGNEMTEIGFSLKKIFEKLKKNEIIGILADQSAHPDYSAYIEFFGNKVSAFSGPAKFSLKQRADLVSGYIFRNKDYTYTLKFEKINFDDLNEYNEGNVIELTQRIQSVFEKIIRADPGQWLWFHKRFKHMKSNV
jgi:KDO2-lipid IV(A) lauroyltransferase